MNENLYSAVNCATDAGPGLQQQSQKAAAKWTILTSLNTMSSNCYGRQLPGRNSLGTDYC